MEEPGAVRIRIRKAIKAEIFKKSYYEFFKWSFKILFPNERYEDAFHVKYLCDLYQSEVERIIRREEKTTDIIVNIPPRTSKSLITSVCLLAWAWIKDPTITCIAISFDDELTLLNAQYCKDIIKSDQYYELFPEVEIRKDSDSKGYFMNTHGGFRLSKTTGSNITGHKGVLILWDDGQNPKTSESEVYRVGTISHWRKELYNRLTPERLGVRIIIQQRLHDEDLTGHLLKADSESYAHICLPAEISDLVKPTHLKQYYKEGLLDPVRLGLKTLNQFRKTLGSRGYAGQYEQTPSPDEGGIVKRDWFDIVEPQSITREPTNEPIHFFVDSAYTDKTANDPTAIIACFLKSGTLYCIDACEVWLDFPTLTKYLQEYVTKFQLSENSKLFIEEAASGLSIIQQLRAVTKLNVIGIKKPKDDKVTRAHSITAKLESRRVKLVKGGYIENFVNQLASFPTGKHDDMLDCLIHAVTELLIGQDTPDILWV